MKYGCIAERLGHSFSKEIHARLSDYEYELIELTPEELDGFMRKKDFIAINVTIPYKQAVIRYLDELDPMAASIGAVNTVVNRGGRLCGYNTDLAGMSALINKIGIDMRGKKVLIAGTGGTAKTATAVSKLMGASEIYKLSRTPDGDSISYAEAYEKHSDAQVIINTTPVGMYPKVEGSHIDLDRFDRLCGVVDAVYNPLRTNLILDARERGIPAEGGLYMLVAQAVCASEHFLGIKYPEETVDRVYGEILAEKENIVLCGMPGCGKSTVGGILSELLDRPLYDSDSEIVKREGREINEIFTERGEGYFRDIEAEVIKSLSMSGGGIIATGGGAVLRRDNVRALKRNGRIVFLDRPLCELVPTPDRPLALSREAIEERYRERYSIYLSSADVRVETETVEKTAEKVSQMIRNGGNKHENKDN